MGMFDEIGCDMPLLGWSGAADAVFQTKCIECELNFYKITRDGKLMLVRDRQHKDRSLPVAIPFHGYITFYTYTGSHEDKTFTWFEWVAKFTDGLCVNIEKQESNA